MVLAVLMLAGVIATGARASNGDEVSKSQLPDPAIYAELGDSADGAAYVIVMLKPVVAADATSKIRPEAVRGVQGRVMEKLDPWEFTPVYKYENFPAMTGRVTAAGLAKLVADPEVIAVGPDALGHGHLDDSVPFIKADDVHALGYTGDGITVAVLDTGIDSNHNDLSDDLASGWYHFLSKGAYTGPGAEDDHGHGTNVSGIITSKGQVASVGVAPDADILAIKVLGSDANGWVSDWAKGVDYVVSHKNDYDNLCVINMSLGTDTLYSQCPCDNVSTYTLLLQTSLQAAKNAGIVTFASSGNDGSCTSMSSPACLSAASAVAAVYDQDLDREPDSGTYQDLWSSFADCYDATTTGNKITCFSNRSGCNELAAPGRRITAPGMGGGTSTYTGTSQAAPHCAGVAALMCERADALSVSLTPNKIVQIMKKTGVPTIDNCLTYPNPIRVDALAAVNAVEPVDEGLKWSQPPVPTEPNNLYYGWNELSIYDGNQIVADDWPCENEDPITDIHWWGSFQGWTDSFPPQMPDSFHITIWNDIPDPNPYDPHTFSHPNEVVWEIDCSNFQGSFVGWDYDPRTKSYEACFYFEQYLAPSEYFFQRPQPDGTEPTIYWISIAARYPAGTIVDNPWGWKTRPRIFNDDAVRIFTPTNPHMGDSYRKGEPIYWPNPNQSWDMAFELTAGSAGTYPKWEQQPDITLTGLHCHDRQDAAGSYASITLADDWQCDGGDVTDLHWYGNYETDALGNEMRGFGIRNFHLSIHKPGATACLPGPLLWEDVNVPFASVNETDTGLVNSENCKIYKYEYDLATPFPQEQYQNYWFDISAYSVDPMNPAIWRWQESARSPTPKLCGAASKTEPPVPGQWKTIVWSGDPPRYSDMAFAVTSEEPGEVYVKWSQPPEPYTPPAYEGWNEVSVYNWQQIAADDWFCETDSPVTDIHWWGSYIGWSCEDEPPVVPESFHIAIWTDVPLGIDDFSHPGKVIWETVCKDFTCEFVGWDIDPRLPDVPPYLVVLPEACFKFEQDLLEKDWFKQKTGGNIYWLSIAAMYPAGSDVEYPWGWKTRRRDPRSKAPDDAVRIFNPTAPVLYSAYIDGYPIYWPSWDDSWDLAFELTTKEIPPKQPVPHLKWSQPPIEIDPNADTPTYCGWDEPSWVGMPVVGHPEVADDFRCLGSMPITSIHWWGSYEGWDSSEPPPMRPIAWWFKFWSNVPADPNYSHPGEVLWQSVVDANLVHSEWVGYDSFPEKPSEASFQYYVDLKPDEIFWQADFKDKTIDDIFWLGIVALYPQDIMNVTNPWGWKTRPWPWMDDAVSQQCRAVQPGVIYCGFWPIEDIFGKSHDMAFELDTDPNYIKWEQPFTGIRNWPHYEDEKSMATVQTITEVVTKWIQQPDPTERGMDVDATDDDWITWPPQLLADDFLCEMTGPITDIHIWGSWYHDLLPYDDPTNVWFTLSIHDNNPAGPGGWSEPIDPPLWVWDFGPGEFEAWPSMYGEEGYYVPCIEYYEPFADTVCWRYDFYIDRDEAFVQKEGRIYWLNVQAHVQPNPGMPEPVRFGWKTRDPEDGHFMDDAVWAVGWDWDHGPWQELRYPPQHPYAGYSLDLAFELTTDRVSTEFVIDRLVADDWKCERRTPVTAAVWWGSYLGYQYKPCYGEYMALPVRPDYFLLNIWTDVPANEDSTVPFSHPNEIIWEHKAYDYDEVLVGFDKHPLSIPGTDQLGREPVFRYSVHLPEDNWFLQKDVNDIYWFSVVAVYEDPLPVIYPWGWTNHKHVFNDDAVAGVFDPPAGWFWQELFDQNGDTEDMSFMLFTDPDECVSCADYNSDSIVNFIDYADFADDWRWIGPAGGYNNSDLNCNGIVDFYDLDIFTQQWLSSCP